MMHHVMRTLVYAPLLVSGFHEEIQLIDVELFNDFVDNQVSAPNLFFVSLLFILSFWHLLQDGLPDYLKAKLAIEIKEDKTENETEPCGKVKLELEDCFPFDEEEFQELEDLGE